ncbi:MAG TPA: radical SAM protein [Vicinamibacterales bacterium]|nr:radical SAM protein [Vicinamibacterales bacterium]
MSTIDCLIVGNNQMQFPEYAATLRAMGPKSGAYRDLRLSYYRDDSGEVVTCRDFCNRREGSHALEMSYDDILSATIAYLGTFLHRHGFSFGYVNSFQEGKADLERTLRAHDVGVVAITTTYYVSPLPLLQVVEFVRTLDPDVKIVVGGPLVRTQHQIHAPASFEFLLRQIGADFYVVSDQGEQTLVNLLAAIRSGAGYRAIPNLIYKENGGYVSNTFAPEDNDLTRNLVDWTLFATDARPTRRRMVMARTARSCPFACAFCSFPAHAGAYRYLDPVDIWRELDQVEALGCVNSVTFIDDTFNVPLQRFEQILHGLCERRYSFRWNCNFRCQYATPEVVALMKASGCEGVFLGLESGSDAVLKNMNKSATANDYRRGVAMLREAGILTYGSFIIGFPGETPGTVRETIDFIEEAAPDFFRAQLWYYDTMTPVHRDAAKYGLRNSQFEWSHHTMQSEEAAEWVDYLHGNIKSSVWLPQNDFDFPSLFCLLSRGWTRQGITEVVRTFNRRVLLGLGGTAVPDDSAYLDRQLLRGSGFGFDDDCSPGAS